MINIMYSSLMKTNEFLIFLLLFLLEKREEKQKNITLAKQVINLIKTS